MASPPDSTRLSLLNKLQSQDEDAYQRLVDLYGPWLYRRCRKRGLSAHDAEDVVQEVFRAVFRNFAQFKRKSFRGWLAKIQVHEVLDQARRAGNEQPRGGSDHLLHLQNLPAPQSLTNVAAEESVSSDCASMTGPAHLALKLLEESGRFEAKSILAFKHTELEGWTSAEVAAKYNMTVTAVRNAKVRVRRALRKLLLDDDAQP